MIPPDAMPQALSGIALPDISIPAAALYDMPTDTWNKEMTSDQYLEELGKYFKYTTTIPENSDTIYVTITGLKDTYYTILYVPDKLLPFKTEGGNLVDKGVAVMAIADEAFHCRGYGNNVWKISLPSTITSIRSMKVSTRRPTTSFLPLTAAR